MRMQTLSDLNLKAPVPLRILLCGAKPHWQQWPLYLKQTAVTSTHCGHGGMHHCQPQPLAIAIMHSSQRHPFPHCGTRIRDNHTRQCWRMHLPKRPRAMVSSRTCSSAVSWLKECSNSSFFCTQDASNQWRTTLVTGQSHWTMKMWDLFCTY